MGGKLIKPKYIYYGLAGLGATALLTAYIKRDNTQPAELEQNKNKLDYDDDDVYKLYIALEEEGLRLDDLSDKQLKKLLKKMKV